MINEVTLHPRHANYPTVTAVETNPAPTKNSVMQRYEKKVKCEKIGSITF